MIGASKILTVSYGTFSCTLEGFDDPFNTMKAIAEYFRDLAAEDRYFGAEPPTPDAAMLHKIAEREIHRRVEAKIQENGVILRAGLPHQAPDMVPQPMSQTVAQTGAALATEDAPRIELPVAVSEPAPADVELPDLQADPAEVVAATDIGLETGFDTGLGATVQDGVDPLAESVAAKLTRIRSAVAQSRPAAAAVAPDYVEDDLSDLEPADHADPMPDSEPVPEAGFDSEAADSLLHDLPAFEAASVAPVADLGGDDLDLDDLDDEAALSGLLGALNEAPAAAPPTVAEAVDLAEADLEDLVEAEEGFDLSALDQDPAAAILAETGADIQAEAEVEVEAEAEPEIEIDLGVLGFAPEPARAPASEKVASEKAVPEGSAPEAPAAEAPVSDRIQRARARVIRIRRSPADDATPADVTAELPAAMPNPADTGGLTPEAEADLMRELAEVQAEARLIPADEAAALRPTRPVRPLRPTRPIGAAVTPPPAPPVAASTEEGEEAVSRLLAETNSQLAGPENRRRLAAIQQLKAAVAATVADRRAGAARPVNDAERQTPYRHDLSRMVRPDGDDTQDNRPSPLVLVSEQRVDRSAAVAPVRPQRVAVAPAAPQVASPAVAAAPLPPASDLADLADEDEVEDLDDGNIFTDTRGFAEFAEKLGVQGLPALMEAAAAYTACVEGRPHFSRPQLMRQVAALDSADSTNREDSLRSFGTLLRNGKIVKVRRGHYALSDRSHLLSEARKLVG